MYLGTWPLLDCGLGFLLTIFVEYVDMYMYIEATFLLDLGSPDVCFQGSFCRWNPLLLQMLIWWLARILSWTNPCLVFLSKSAVLFEASWSLEICIQYIYIYVYRLYIIYLEFWCYWDLFALGNSKMVRTFCISIAYIPGTGPWNSLEAWGLHHQDLRPSKIDNWNEKKVNLRNSI